MNSQSSGRTLKALSRCQSTPLSLCGKSETLDMEKKNLFFESDEDIRLVQHDD